MNYPIYKKVIIRTNHAGAFYGTLAEYDEVNRTAEIYNCRRLWFWDGACSLSQLAVDGTKKPESCKFTLYVPTMQVMEVIEILPCTDKAIESIESVIIWKS